MDPDMRLGIQMTHSDECYRWHHECAIVRVDSLRARIVELEDERDRWYGAAHERMIKINGLESTCRVQGQVIADQRARIEVLEKAIEWACVRLGIVNDPAYSGYTHDLCNEVIAELRRRAKEG